MTCPRDGCGGTVDDTGYCDRCGLPPPAAPRPPGPAVDRWAAPTVGGEAGPGTEWIGGAASLPAELPPLASPDPEDLVSDLPVPEHQRYCGRRGCGVPVGRARAGRPGLTRGHCPHCGTPYDFRPPLRRGEDVGRYRVVGPLAHGGLGWVFLARDTQLDNRWFVLKGLINDEDDARIESFVNERRWLTELDHPNIVRIFDFVSHRAARAGYLVMDFVPGYNLQQLIDLAAAGRYELRAWHVVGYGLQILDAFHYLHTWPRRQLLYCDLKPANVMYDGHRVRLIDLGAIYSATEDPRATWGTAEFRAPTRELRTRGVTVRSDLHTVGRTLAALLAVSPDVRPDSPVAAGVASLRRLLDRAAHPTWGRRFASAGDMREQLVGVRREIWALRGRPLGPAPSTRFNPVNAARGPLDDDLGRPLTLRPWVSAPAAPAVLRTRPLGDGRPTPHQVAVGLPEPQLDRTDPAADRLASVTADEPYRLITALSQIRQRSVEIGLWRCRARLALPDYPGAENELRAAAATAAADAETEADAERAWRITWHRALIALARADPAVAPGPTIARDWVVEAERLFADVHATLPGEVVPKLALGYCAEYLGRPDSAAAYYDAVWRTDNTQVSAAFGLARVHLVRHDRDAAVAVLDSVPDVSRGYDAAQIAAVRVRAGAIAGLALPDAADLTDAARRLAASGRQDHPFAEHRAELRIVRELLATSVRQAALDWVLAAAAEDPPPHGPELFGERVTEDGLRRLLEGSFRFLAEHEARNADEHGTLIDLANTVRPRTPW